MLSPFIDVGEVLRPQGIRGEIKVRPWTDVPEELTELRTLYLRAGEGWTPLTVEAARVREGFAYLRLEGCGSADAAEKLRGCALYAAREDLGEPEGDTDFIADLIGCRAVDEGGRELGVLRDVLQYGPTDVYAFDAPEGGWMAPALKVVFTAVDKVAGVIRVDAVRLGEVIVRED